MLSSQVEYDTIIPNNVSLSSDRRVLKALEKWHPGYIDWWKDLGPVGFQDMLVYLRTAINVDKDGWATFDYVKMPEYRWGILLAPQKEGRTIPFGDHIGEPVWQEVPGEYRSMLRRLIVIQGDTEPASIEQQRFLGSTAPSLYDMRNLFQVNVEEGRHLWAMVYLLQKYFGSDGREEANELLKRQSGSEDAPRMLGAFNESTPDWLSFFMFTAFTDRDGKMQLEALAQSGFDPLSRTCRFMLTEEAHHMFVGETGVGRVIKRSLEVMTEIGTDDPVAIRQQGAVDLETLQRYLNFWFTSSLDLFGSEISSNAAMSFASGIKGRPDEGRYEDHLCNNATYDVDTPEGMEKVNLRNAMNDVTRGAYVKDCEIGIKRWNMMIKRAKHDVTLSLPSTRFNRTIGSWANVPTDPNGQKISQADFDKKKSNWLPTESDQSFIRSLMQCVNEPGKMAGWIAPPDRGINNNPVDYEYVRLK